MGHQKKRKSKKYEDYYGQPYIPRKSENVKVEQLKLSSKWNREKRSGWTLLKERVCFTCGQVFPRGSNCIDFLNHVRNCKKNV